MKEILENYTSYNLWANTRIIGVVKSIDPKLIDAEVKSSFPSIRKTLEHMYMAEEVWNKRLHGESLKDMPKAEKDFTAFTKIYTNRSQSFINLTKSNDETFFSKKITYQDLKGNAHANTGWHMIMHCMNHSTLHRGQVITMLREHGVTSIPATDMIVFFRES